MVITVFSTIRSGRTVTEKNIDGEGQLKVKTPVRMSTAVLFEWGIDVPLRSIVLHAKYERIVIANNG